MQQTQASPGTPKLSSSFVRGKAANGFFPFLGWASPTFCENEAQADDLSL